MNALQLIFTAFFLTLASGAPVPVPVPGGGSSSSSSKTLVEIWGSSGNSYPTVFIHGLLGWGEAKPLLGVLNYWGGITQNILAELRDKGYAVSAPAVGPLSSNWERACEAYAQITGTLTDYGIARSTAFGHLRFGEDHTGNALVPGFMETTSSKINLVGHSMGGPTQRLLTHLLTYGSPAEISACVAANAVCSPLFWTNKTTSYVNGVFALSGVHQGSVFDDILQANAGFLNFFKELILLLIGANSFDNINIYDMQLGHWGLTQGADEPFFTFLERILQSNWVNEQSNALFDLSTAGLSSPLLSFVKESPSTTYFSLSGLTTDYILGDSYAELTTTILLSPVADTIGAYNNSQFSVLKEYSKEDWRQNDGLVAIASSRSPSSGYSSYGINIQSSSASSLASSAPSSSPVKGKYNYVGSLDNTDHLQIVGLFDIIPGLRTNVFNNILTIISSLSA
ncbi:hypothetical protein HK100_006489 [Physocladia obscura]|uniref:Lipase-like C-terminal domain-containing protein n=1 Tax=Physocladia obscura TaxID=109957 RepID=A0AAD5SRS3_9FUNG|nr:hypothetical protein HK100_006489 [Physocladia obscura]